MQCSSCGAPMTPVEGRGYLACRYCSTFHFPGELVDSADRVTPLGEGGEVWCPACHVELSHGAIDGAQLLYCEKCRGLLVESEVFAHVVKKRRAARTDPPDEPQPLDRDELARHIDCPNCRKPMDVHPYYGPGNAVIDSCCRCRLIWLDHGELGAIERAPGRS